MFQGRVTVKHLNDEPVDDHDRCQKTIAPTVTSLSAGIVDGFLVEVTCEVLPKLTNRGNNPLMHPRGV